MQLRFLAELAIHRGRGMALTGLVFALNASAATFPGGEPITPADLTATPPALPAAPPAYDPSDPITHEQFARFVWREFIYLNSPSNRNGNTSPGVTPIVRGVIDPNGSFVASGDPTFYQTGKTSTDNFSSNILVWEGFAHRSELFPKNATPTGDFQTLNPQYLFTNVTVPSVSARFNNLDENSQIGLDKIFFPKNDNTPSTDPYDDYEILFEAKVNQAEYDYIKSLGGTAPASFELPPNGTDGSETIEVKAAWRVLTNDMIQSGRYHTAEALYYIDVDGTLTPQVGTFGLVGLHIIRKMVNYEALVYSTFEHVDNLTRPDGTDSGVYFITLYTNMSYNNSAGSSPHAIINTGPNRVQVPLPAAGAVIASNGYDFIPGSYDLPAGTAGPIKVVQPPTITKAVYDVNNEVKQAMTDSGQFANSVWQYYQLKGVQPLPVDEDSDVTSPDNPLTQDYFLANNVVESSQPGIQLFKGGIPGDLLTNVRSGAPAQNIQNVPGLPSSANEIIMGGCMGCHGQSKYTQSDGTMVSIFSFLVNSNNLNGTGGFEADELNESDDQLAAKAARYMGH